MGFTIDLMCSCGYRNSVQTLDATKVKYNSFNLVVNA